MSRARRTLGAAATLRRRALLLVVGATLLAVGAVLFVARAPETGADTPSLSHVHGLVINPADRLLYIGTHEGLFRLESDQRRLKRVSEQSHDFMSLTAAGPNRLLASGHPAVARSDLPANLGLIESVDGGKSWKTIALGGQADLHAMRLVGERLYAYGSGTLAVSDDGGQRWGTIASLDLADFVVTPTGDLLATTRNGLVRGPATAGARLTSVEGPPLLWLAVAPDSAFWGVTASGEVFRSADGGVRWERRGTVGGQPGALLAAGDALYVALSSGQLYRSTDGGATWARIGT